MDDKHLWSIVGIDADDWEQTPVSVRKVVERLVLKVEQLEQLEQRLRELEIENQQLREKINRTSKNSHSLLGSDPPNSQKGQKKKPRGKKRGGQPGHRGHSRSLYPVEACERVKDHYPETCGGCGEELTGVDPNPYRHQVVEIPPIELHIEEHRLHQLACLHCGEKTRAVLPEEVEASGYGERVVAIVSVLSGMYRHSHPYFSRHLWFAGDVREPKVYFFWVFSLSSAKPMSPDFNVWIALSNPSI